MNIDPILIIIILSIGILSIIPIIPIYFLYYNPKTVKKFSLYLIGFAAGSLLATTFSHLLPHAYKKISINNTTICVLVGFLIFFVFEITLKYIGIFSKQSKNSKKVIWLITLSDTIHNLIDGIAISASFLISPKIGIATFISVFLHEIPQEISDFGILINYGATIFQSLKINFFSSLSALVGALATYYFYEKIHFTNDYILALTAGGFIYLSGTTLIPEIHKISDIKTTIFQTLFLLIGASTIFIMGQII